MSESDGATEVAFLLAPQRALRERFDAFHRALERRDQTLATSTLHEFEAALHRRIAIELRVLVPALLHVGVPGRSPRRELELQYVQLRELTRHVREKIENGGDSEATRGEILGFVVNLDRRLTAHAAEMERVYYPAAVSVLNESDRVALARDS